MGFPNIVLTTSIRTDRPEQIVSTQIRRHRSGSTLFATALFATPFNITSGSKIDLLKFQVMLIKELIKVSEYLG